LPKTKAFQYEQQINNWCSAIKENYHPNAYLQFLKNFRSGLKARTKIIELLEEEEMTAGAIAKVTLLSYDVTLHHLRLLEREKIVCRKGKKPFFWISTGLGQKRLPL